MDRPSPIRKPWHRPRNMILGTVAFVFAIIGWAAYETVAVMRARPNPTVNYAAGLRELSEHYVRGPWDRERAEEAWRHLEEARDLSEVVLAELKDIMRSDPQRYPPRFEFDTAGPDFEYVRFGRELPGDIGREREALAALRVRGVFESLAHFAELAPGFPEPRMGDLLDPLSGGVGALRSLSRASIANMRIAASDRDDDEVLNCFDRTLAIGQTLSHQGVLIKHLVGHSIVALATEEMRNLLIERSFDAEQCRELLTIMNRRELPPMELILEGERAFLKEFVQFNYSDDGSGNGYALMGDLLGDGMGFGTPQSAQGLSATDAFMSRFVFPGRRAFTVAADHFYDLAVADSNLAPDERLNGASKAEAFAESLSGRHMMLKLVAPAIEKSVRNDRSQRMLFEATRIMIALELHRAERGHFPESLDDLAPAYLPSQPVDPIHGGPFGYRPLDDDEHGRPYLLYSYGLDGMDDGGRQLADDEFLFRSPLHDPEVGAGYDFIINTSRAEWDYK